MCVFIAGHSIVGVSGSSARKSEVCYQLVPLCSRSSRFSATYCEIVTQPAGDLGEHICRTRRNYDEICPAAKLR